MVECNEAFLLSAWNLSTQQGKFSYLHEAPLSATIISFKGLRAPSTAFVMKDCMSSSSLLSPARSVRSQNVAPQTGSVESAPATCNVLRWPVGAPRFTLVVAFLSRLRFKRHFGRCLVLAMPQPVPTPLAEPNGWLAWLRKGSSSIPTGMPPPGRALPNWSLVCQRAARLIAPAKQ